MRTAMPAFVQAGGSRSSFFRASRWAGRCRRGAIAMRSRQATRGEIFRDLAKGVHADLDGYRCLRTLLDEQFEAALHHRTGSLADIAERITDVVDTIELRRAERLELARSLLGEAGPFDIGSVCGMLSETSRQAFRSSWEALENLVRECKAQNVRNGRLLMDQYEIMQRVLNGEADTYAPL